MSDAATPQPDRVEGAPHPRDTPALIGQGAAEAAFLDAFTGGRLHHGWLLTGPRGVGKATLAWRIARFLLATPAPGGDGGLFGAPPRPETLAIPGDHPVAARVRAGSDPGLYHITRSVNPKTDRLRAQIVAEDVRDLNRFLQLSSTEGGHRVVIIDSADEMNVQAANALLKMLEEPPARTTLLLVSHAPARLLPTIRSRCRELRLLPLSPDDMARALAQAGVETDSAEALAALAAGSVGEAVRLANLGGLDLYAELLAIVGSLPRLDRPRALALADTVAARGAEDRLDLLLSLLDVLLARLARTGATGTPPDPPAAPGEAETLARLAPDPSAARAWADRAAEIGARARHARAVNLDPAALVLDTVFRLKETA
ncbi:DNA polymerase III subunit delta' [Roseovarius sp. SCSIO 43702]|uniref:DNA polymerase III subunit delta' n=1 Tax=Roseovarius sp. SCSIO 43702 TaxID=2823043 RepID=UPI001C7309FE|nr:DNA polymerase III subunit delta' [Roseovarius sp. SCSIO 43702]QYX55938.1 DNA polymerase III subunit delta' [Roseovarius sp. SCSIO 43702]